MVTNPHLYWYILKCSQVGKPQTSKQANKQHTEHKAVNQSISPPSHTHTNHKSERLWASCPTHSKLLLTTGNQRPSTPSHIAPCDQISRPRASLEGDNSSTSRSTRTNNLQHWYLSLRSMVLVINSIGQWLFSWVSGKRGWVHYCVMTSAPWFSTDKHPTNVYCNNSVPILKWLDDFYCLSWISLSSLAVTIRQQFTGQ